MTFIEDYTLGAEIIKTNQPLPSKNEYPVINDQSNLVIIEEVRVLFQYQIYSEIEGSCPLLIPGVLPI